MKKYDPFKMNWGVSKKGDPWDLKNMIRQKPWNMNFNINLNNPLYYPSPYKTQRVVRRQPKQQPRRVPFTMPVRTRPSWHVAIEREGVQTKRSFRSENEARAFRNRVQATGEYENISQVYHT